MAERPVVVVATRFTEAVEQRIARDYEPRWNPHDRELTMEELLAAARGAAALLVTPSNRLDAEFFRQVDDSVKIVASVSAGYEHVDLPAARARGIAVSNTPDVTTEATADLTLLLLLGASRRAWEGQLLVRSGEWRGLKPTELLGRQMGGHTLGIYGMGRIGRAVARRAQAFGMQVHYCNRRRLRPEEEGGAVFHDTIEELLPRCHFLTLHAPLTPETREVLQRRTLAMLPEGAVVVNAARGGLVRDEDLIAALEAGHIAAAGLDVYAGEPAIDARYRTMLNVFLLPHLGSATEETRTAMGMLALDNVAAVLGGWAAPSLLV